MFINYKFIEMDILRIEIVKLKIKIIYSEFNYNREFKKKNIYYYLTFLFYAYLYANSEGPGR